MKRRDVIIIEGTLHCPSDELKKIATECGYKIKFVNNYNSFKKQGTFKNLGSRIATILIGPRPHKIKNGKNKNLCELEGSFQDEIPVFVCTIFTKNLVIKITKSSFIQAFSRFILWKQLNSEQGYLISNKKILSFFFILKKYLLFLKRETAFKKQNNNHMTKRILTGIQPSDKQLHLGNYFGAIKPMIQLSESESDAEFFMFLANMHAFTKLHDGPTLRENAINIVKLYLACGIDAKKFNIYNPAEIPAHAQLNRVLGCLTIMGTMERMHSYKDAVAKGKAGEVSVGTFNYPILMAADIILYDADFVPVGKDQKQHVEYARDIALKFNREFGETFIVPEPKIDPNVATIIGSDGRKMSKSYNNYIGLLDDEKTILKRVKQIPTSTQTVEESKNPDECNVYQLAKYFLTPNEDAALRKRYTDGGLSFKESKEYLFEKIMETVTPIQQKFAQISDQEVLELLQKGKENVAPIAEKKIKEVYQKIGFILQ